MIQLAQKYDRHANVAVNRTRAMPRYLSNSLEEITDKVVVIWL